jgi:hypothetical protein
MRNSPDTTNRDLGAGRTQVARSGPSGMDAARAAPRHGWRMAAGPRSVAGVRERRRRSRQTRSRTLGYLVSFQVTRRRRNRSGVSQSPICRAAIRWRIRISSCTPNPMGAVRQPRPRWADGGRSVDNFITDPPLRCRRDLRRLPQELGREGELRSLWLLILIFMRASPDDTDRDLGAG